MKSIIFSLLAITLPATLLAQEQAIDTGIVFGRSFVPDYTFKMSGLKGHQTIGQADWTLQNGELVGKAKPGTTGGWLLLDSSYQDIGFHAVFKVTDESQTGVLLRLEKTAAGMKGIFLSVNRSEVVPYRISLDNNGKELGREKLRYAGGIAYRMAPPPAKNDTFAPKGNIPALRPLPAVNLPLTRPNTDLRTGEWNQVEVFLEENVIRTFLNDGREIGGALDGDSAVQGYGQVALFAGGSGEVRFKDILVKDIAIRNTPREESSPRFKVQRINDMYYSWGADAADFNRDGHTDIVAGPYIHFGPDYTRHREIFPAVAVGPSKEFSLTSYQYASDFNNDGWPDVLDIEVWAPTGATLYINPKGQSRRWASYEVIPIVQSEISEFADIDKDGIPELIYVADGSVRYAKPDKVNPTHPWQAYIISEKGYALAHGIGTGDLNGDGRLDILNAYGWWEQPAALDTGKLWKYHPVAFGRYGHRSSNIGGSIMAVYDVNGDGLNDVVSNLNVHGFGLAWFEQRRNSNGSISFTRHMISDDYSTRNAGNVTFSQPHGATFADVDKDGIKDFIVGKRFFAHRDNMYDPDPYSPPVLYWYRTVRNPKAPGGAEFVPELIHNRSGAGSQISAVDLNKDGAVDIITSTNRGTFIFWGTAGYKTTGQSTDKKASAKNAPPAR